MSSVFVTPTLCMETGLCFTIWYVVDHKMLSCYTRCTYRCRDLSSKSATLRSSPSFVCVLRFMPTLPFSLLWTLSKAKNLSITLGLHICASDKSNSEANDECPDYILASCRTSSLALLFVALALKAVFLTHTSQRTCKCFCESLWFSTYVKTVHSHSDNNLRMFVQLVR